MLENNILQVGSITNVTANTIMVELFYTNKTKKELKNISLKINSTEDSSNNKYYKCYFFIYLL